MTINFNFVDMPENQKKEIELKKRLKPLKNRMDMIDFLENHIDWKQPPKERPQTLEELRVERNKLNRQIATLKKATLND